MFFYIGTKPHSDRFADGNRTTEYPVFAACANLGKYVEGSLVGQWVEFPTTDDRIREVLEEIGIDGDRCEEIFIADYDCNINGFSLICISLPYAS